MKMEEWDEKIGERLDDIYHCASWIRHYADRIRSNVGDLPLRPPFPTIAIVEVQKAIEELERSVVGLKVIREQYEGKKVVE